MVLRYRWYMFVKEAEAKEGIVGELEFALREVDCRTCKTLFSWDPIFQDILHVEVECPTFEDARACDGRIKARLIEECERRNIPHTIGEFRALQ